jgi:hypothetical protein
MEDKNGNILKVGDIVHNEWGYDLIVSKNDKLGWYGTLVCEENHSCKDIPYALYPSEIELLHK